jgi:endonuclease/exonuclease/phosphatase family metal-dependent hydrolase
VGKWFAVCVCIAVSACSSFPEPVAVPQLGEKHPPVVKTDPETGKQYVEISVLIYNVWGLPWPLSANSISSLQKIGEILGEMRAEGTEPDIVLLQEAFTMKSNPVQELSGYPNIVGGPVRGDPSAKVSQEQAPEFLDGRSIWKGEGLGKWLNSGLAIMSNFPIEEKYAQPFRRSACAGFDCMSNKGMLVATIHIPGVPEPLEVFNTHMNSNTASGVSPERSKVAHNLQANEILDLLTAEIYDDRRALIAAGDFNTKGDKERLESLTGGGRNPTTRFYCTQSEGRCDIRTSFDGDEPWMDTQDLQAFFPGARIDIKPIAIEAMFDEPVDGVMLSDHDAYLVEYRVSWNLADF